MIGRNHLVGLVKPILTRTVLREGSVRRIRRGPSRGLRYRIFPGYGLAPLIGQWEPEAQAIMRNKLMPGDVAYDIGANHGIHTLLMARLVGPSGRVYAFEPMPELHTRLCDNVRLNTLQNVTCVEKGVSARSGHALFVSGEHSGAGHLATEREMGTHSGGNLSVRVTSIDDFVAEGASPPTFMKIDVEGAEASALEGAAEMLGAHRPMMLIELHNPDQDRSVGQILLEHGYIALRAKDLSPVPRLDVGWPDPQGIWGQVLAVPAESDTSVNISS